MLVSMTGFGRSSRETSFGRIVIEIQSVNRKHLDISLQLPREFSFFEREIRKWVAESVVRGQITLRVSLEINEAVFKHLLPSPDLLRGARKAWIELAKASGLNEDVVNLPFLLERLPSLPSRVFETEYLSELEKGVRAALKDLVDMRRVEGLALTADLTKRLEMLRRTTQQIESCSPDAVQRQREKLKERMEAVCEPGVALDERILREVALFAERVDIAEEITRLYSHFDQFEEVLRGAEGQGGRTLDFIVQEMGREVNTIASKASDVAISRCAIEAKSCLDRIREQIQNVE